MRRRAVLAVRGAAVILAAIAAWPLVGAETRPWA